MLVYTEFQFPGENRFFMGYMNRLHDSSIANVGFGKGDLAIGISYDFNTSSLSKATAGRGGFRDHFNLWIQAVEIKNGNHDTTFLRMGS